MTCQEATQLIPLFFDGELESHRMREVALHVTQCTSCKGILSDLTKLQRLVAGAIMVQVEEIDPSYVWQQVAEQIDHLPLPWSTRSLVWWRETFFWKGGISVWASATAALMLVAFLWWGGEESTEPPRMVARNQAQVEVLSTSMPAIAMWSEQRDGTTVIWVADEEPGRKEKRVP
jgi:anti-sigma factor RsiW